MCFRHKSPNRSNKLSENLNASGLLASITVNVAYFAQARELAGTKEDEFVLNDPADMNHLLSEIMNAHPKLQGIRDVLSSLVNGRAVWENVSLNHGDRVTLFPPVGGG